MIIQNAYGINTINGSHTIVNRLIISVIQKIIKAINSISMFFLKKIISISQILKNKIISPFLNKFEIKIE